MSRYDAVLFDNDGVLVHPPAQDTQLEAARDAFEAMGVEGADDTHLAGVAKGVTVDLLDEICAAYDLNSDAFWAAREHHDERCQLDAFRAGVRGCYDDVTAVEEIVHDCGVVSNNHHSTVEFILDFFELRSLFEAYYGREKTVDSLRLKKPNPHYIDRALSDLGADTALYVGDTESDIVAAHEANVDSAFVRRSHCRDVDLSVTPTYEVESLYGVAEIVDG